MTKQRGAWIFLLAGLVLLCALLAWRLAGRNDVAGPGAPGSYTAEAQGYGGPVRVEIRVNRSGGLASISVEASDETPEIGGVAVSRLMGEILDRQSWRVDDVSGATGTSRAVRRAARDAMLAAGGPAD